MPLERLPLCASAKTRPPVFFFVILHPGPEVFGIEAFGRCVRAHHAGPDYPVAVEDVSVQVVAVLGRSPLIADQRGENAGLIHPLGGFEIFVPNGLLETGVENHIGDRSLGKGVDHFERGIKCGIATLIDLVVPFPHGVVDHQRRAACNDMFHRAHTVGVVRYHQPVKRAVELERQPVAGNNLFATGESQGVLNVKSNTQASGIQ
jgi:hypothetical protein